MSYFEFLDDEPKEPATGYVPEGWQVRRKGKDYWENDQTAAGPDDELRQRDQTPTATDEEQKTYSQRRGESTAKVMQAADAIIGKYESQAPMELKQAAAQARTSVRANPEDAAKTLEKFYDVAKQIKPGEKFGESGTFKSMPDLYDNDFSALENHVRGIRTMKRGAEEGALTGQLAQTDLNKNLTELQTLKGQLDTLTRDIATQNLPEAVSKAGENQNRQILAGKQQQAAALAEHIKQLENQTQQAKVVNAPPNVSPEAGPGEQDELDSIHGSIKANVEGMGKSYDHFKLAMVAADRKITEATGVDTQNMRARVPFSQGLMTALKILDPSGTVINQLAQEMQDPQQQQQGPTGPHGEGGGLSSSKPKPEDEHTLRIRELQRQRRAIYDELGRAPEAQNWLTIIAFVLLSVASGSPRSAAGILGIGRKRGVLKDQLDILHQEIGEESGMLRDSLQQQRDARQFAAQQSMMKEGRDEAQKNHVSNMMLQHQLLLERAMAKHPADAEALKNVDKAFKRYSVMAAKFGKTKDDPYADEADKKAAKIQFDRWIKKAEAANSILEDAMSEPAGAGTENE
jgi:hypothetical protein